MKNQLTIILIVAATVASIAAPAEAWVTHGRWSGNRVTMRAASVSFPSGSSYRTALGTIVSRFYNNPSEQWFRQWYNDSSVGFNNGQNEVWFSSSSTYNPAVTFWWYSWWTGRIREADVVFYNGVSYTSSMNKTSLWSYGGSRRPFQTTAIHEYGHAAGLRHEDDEYNIMGQDWTHITTNSSTSRSYVGEDACDGLVALYGRASGGSFEDVSATMFRRTGSSGGYSTHGLCRMFNSGGGLLSSSSFNGQRRYNVSRGQRVRVQFTYENNGETTRTISVGYYISTNSYISTGDTRFATQTMTLGRGDVYTWSKTLYIPWSLSSGQTRYLGVIVDYNNGLSETDGVNNAAYHIIRVN